MTEQTALAEMVIEDVISRWPQTARVFHAYNMACVGCPVAPFYTIADAVLIYDLTLDDFIAELQAVIPEDAAGGSEAA